MEQIFSMRYSFTYYVLPSLASRNIQYSDAPDRRGTRRQGPSPSLLCISFLTA
jgi:hypothetical protein